jgi:hypothetical protein
MHPVDREAAEYRRQADADRRDLERIERALSRDRELNETLGDWTDARGRPLPGLEPVDVEDGDPAFRRAMRERFGIERRALRRRRRGVRR